MGQMSPKRPQLGGLSHVFNAFARRTPGWRVNKTLVSLGLFTGFEALLAGYGQSIAYRQA